MQLIFVKMLLFVDLQKWIRRFCLLMIQAYVRNDYIFRDLEYIDRFCSNFLCHCILNQVDVDTDLLDNVILTKFILQPTEKPRSVGPQKSNRLLYLSMNQTCITITYWGIHNTLTAFVLIFLIIVFSIKLIQISIGKTMCF